MKKRFVSILAAMALVTSMLPTVSAADEITYSWGDSITDGSLASLNQNGTDTRMKITFPKAVDTSTATDSNLYFKCGNRIKSIQEWNSDKTVCYMDFENIQVEQYNYLHITTGLKYQDGTDVTATDIQKGLYYASVGSVCEIPYSPDYNIIRVPRNNVGVYEWSNVDNSLEGKINLTFLSDNNWCNYNSDWADNAKSKALTSGSYLLLDLGAEYNVANIAIRTEGSSATTAYPYTIGTELYGLESLNTPISQATKIMSAMTGDEVLYEHIQQKSFAPANYRYLLLVNPSNNMRIGDIAMYALQYNSFGTWSAYDIGADIEFTLPIESITIPDKTYTTYLTSYDSNGAMTSFVPETHTVSAYDVSISDAISKGTDTLYSAVLIGDTSKMNIIGDVGYYGTGDFSKTTGTASDFNSAITTYQGMDFYRITGKSVDASDKVSVTVIKSDASDDQAESVFESFTTPHYFAAANSGAGYEFKIPFTEEGKYHIRLVRSAENGSVQTRYFSCTMADIQSQSDLVDAFVSYDASHESDNNDANDFADLVSAYITPGTLVLASSLVDSSSLSQDGYTQIFSDIKDIMISELTEAATVGDIVSIINTASVVYRLSQNDSSLISTHGVLVKDNASVKSYVQSNYGYSFNLDITAASGLVSITNFENLGLVEFTFNESMNTSTLTSSNIKIRKKSNNSVVSYTPAAVSATRYSVYVGELESNTEYTIEFTQNCKTVSGLKALVAETFEFSTGTTLKASYRPGKVIRLVSQGKPVTGETADSSFGNLSVLTDGVLSGNTGNVLMAYWKKNAVIDLQDYYEICGVYWKSRKADYFWDFANVEFNGNEINAFGENDDYVTMYKVPQLNENTAAPYVEATQSASSNGRKVRYVALMSEGNPIMYEAKIYAYTDVVQGPWSKPSYTPGTAGNYEFTLPVKYSNASYHILMTAYDANGALKAKKLMQKSPVSDKLIASITVPSDAVGINAAVFSNLANLQQSYEGTTVGTSIKSGNADGGISIVPSDNELTIKVGANTQIKKSDEACIMVVKGDNTVRTPESVFASVNASNLESVIEFMASDIVGDGYKYTLSGLTDGKYYIRVATTDINGNTSSIYFKYTKASSVVKNGIITDLMTADSTTVNGHINDAITADEAILPQQVASNVLSMESDFGQVFVYTRDMLYPDASAVTTVDQIVDIINAAAIVKGFADGDAEEAAELFGQYKSTLTGKVAADIDASNFLTVFSALKSNINSSVSLENVLKWSEMLSAIVNKSNSDKAAALRKYEAQLGINVGYASQMGTTLERAASYISNTNILGLYGTTNFNNAYVAAVAAATAGNDSGGGGSVSGGGSSAGASSFTPAVLPENLQPITPVPEQKPQSPSKVFNDLAGYEWAADAIDRLFEKGIISGDGDGGYAPERNITRAEFLKLLVEATEIKVVENVEIIFDDVPETSWYYPYVKIAYSNKLVNGVSKIEFAPQNYITRQDMAVLINNYLKLSGKGFFGDEKRFADGNSIAEYAKDAVDTISASGIINGYEDGSFRPTALASRAEVAVLIDRLLEKLA